MSNLDRSSPEKAPNAIRRFLRLLKPASLRLTLILSVLLISISAVFWPLVETRVVAYNRPELAPTSSPAVSATLPASATDAAPTASPTAIASQPPTEINEPAPTAMSIDPEQFSESPLSRGTVFLAMTEASHSRLYRYKPLETPFTRLTAGDWDDITPALSPDGEWLAFASNRDQQWDLYLLHLTDGEVTRLTATPEYEASPSWSPDGRLLAYETYQDGNLEVFIRAVDDSIEPIPLSMHPGADFSPSWSPSGRQLAFVSTRSGDREIWLADLDLVGEERFTNLSRNPEGREAHPVWSPDGGSLAWASGEGGDHSIYLWSGAGEPVYAGSGDWPAWSPDGTALLTTLDEPNQTLLTAYLPGPGLLALPPRILPGSVVGLAWGEVDVPMPLPEPLEAAARSKPEELWSPAITPVSGIPNGRQHLVDLEDVQAPYPQLHDLVDDSFKALRTRLAAETGWDLLSSLENAYVPLNDPLPPGMLNDWLYTGRAFALNTLPVNAGWMVVVPEDYGNETYWRVYLRARYQDGSQGMPLADLPWNFTPRFDGNPESYEAGGAPFPALPPGYWIDFTELALAYSWRRVPALSTWRSYYPAARFSEFVLAGGDWRAAMLELYPPEALITPTVILPPTLTPTPTPRWYRTPTPTATSTPLPTLTPLPPTATRGATATSPPPKTSAPAKSPTPSP